MLDLLAELRPLEVRDGRIVLPDDATEELEARVRRVEGEIFVGARKRDGTALGMLLGTRTAARASLVEGAGMKVIVDVFAKAKFTSTVEAKESKARLVRLVGEVGFDGASRILEAEIASLKAEIAGESGG